MINFEQKLKNRIEFLKNNDYNANISEPEWKYIEDICFKLNSLLNCFEEFPFVVNTKDCVLNGEICIILCYLKNNYCLDLSIFENDKIEYTFYQEDYDGITIGDYIEGFTNSENLISTIKEFLNGKF